MTKFKPIDIISLAIILGGFVLKLMGCDGLVNLIMVSVVAYYYGSAKQHMIEKSDK